jgi:hypothetical protein
MNTRDAWYVVVERQTYDSKRLLPYVVGPFDEATAEAELQSDEGLIFCLLTVDAKSEGYVADECYRTNTPPEGERIIPD